MLRGSIDRYAGALDDRGKDDAAIQVLLRVLVKNSEDRAIRARTTRFVQKPGGLARLLAQFGDEGAQAGDAARHAILLLLTTRFVADLHI